jgi:hypothetical protein
MENYCGNFFGNFLAFGLVLFLTLILLDFFGGFKDFLKGRAPRMR